MPESPDQLIQDLMLGMSATKFTHLGSHLLTPDAMAQWLSSQRISLLTKPLIAARSLGSTWQGVEYVNSKVNDDWQVVEKAGSLRVTVVDHSAVAAVRLLNGLDILAGTVISSFLGNAHGVIDVIGGSPINPWTESALEIADLGSGSPNWFTLRLKATARLLKRLDESNTASGIFVAIILALQPFHSGPAPTKLPPQPNVPQCDISQETGDLVARVQRTVPSGAPFSITYKRAGETITISVGPSTPKR